MAFDETFRPRVNFDETEVFALTGQAREVRELHPSHFAGPVAEWADERERNFGDTIIPRHVYAELKDGKMHRVAWIYHQGVEFIDEGYIPFERHHIACDCLLESEHEGDTELMFNCEALLKVLNKRAWWVNSVYGTEDVLMQLPNLPKEALFGVSAEEMDEAFSVAAIRHLLEHDARHPEAWVANILDNEHQVSLLALVLQKPPEDVRELVETIEERGLIDFDGEVLQLTQEERDRIYADKVIRSITERVEEELKAA